ncbi:hypothetical protein Tco_0257264 [Tanacetum coccineum]
MGKKIVVTEASVRRDHQLDDEEGTDCLPNATSFEELTRIGSARIVSSDEASLGDQEDASKQGRKIHDIDADEDITLENVHDDDIMFDVSDLAGEEVFFAEQGVPDNKKDDAAQVNTAVVSTASTILVSAAIITEDEITLAQVLAKLKSDKPTSTASIRPKAKGLVIHEEEQATTLTVSSQQHSHVKVQEKGKGILVEEPVKSIKKKDQIILDEQLAFKLQAKEEEEEEEEEERLTREKVEANKKILCNKKAEEKRNRPPTRAQQRSIMCTYLKNMAGWKPKDLKSKTELVEGTEMEESSKKAEESSSKRKKQKPRKPKKKDTEAPQPSGPTTNVADEAFIEENVSKHSNDPLLSGSKIASLKRRVKKLEKKNKSRTHKLKRLYKVGLSRRVESSDEASLGDQEDASKQGRKIDDIDTDARITLVNDTQGRHDDDLMFDTSVLNNEKVFARHDMDKKEVSTADLVTTAGKVVTTANVEVSTASPTAATITNLSESTTTTTTIPSKDKGKGIMVEEPLKIKKKDQISFDEQEAIRLQAEFDEEVRLAREKDEANVALIEEWNDIQAKIDADYQMAKQMQAEEQEELSIKEKSKLFVQLLEARKKHFAAKRAEEKRNMPPTRAQERSIMCSEVRAEGSKIREENSSKRAGDEQEQEKAKKQKVVEDKETTKLQSLMKAIPDEEEVAVDAIPLATKPPSIMLRSFDREDLETLWKLVKAKHGYTRPEEGYERVL